jgi:hypothetical protein
MTKITQRELCKSPNIVSVIKISGTCGRDEKYTEPTKVLLQTFTGRDHLGDLGVDGRIILKRTLEK